MMDIWQGSVKRARNVILQQTMSVLDIDYIAQKSRKGAHQMCLFDYRRSLAISNEPFYALIMAAMRVADSDNLAKLRTIFPGIYDELLLRRNAPAGYLPDEIEKLRKDLPNVADGLFGKRDGD